jgi:uncharacterized tellurite resistance protein B-like protein
MHLRVEAVSHVSAQANGRVFSSPRSRLMMRITAILFAILSVAPSLRAQQADDGCVSCHRGLDDDVLSRPTRLYENDIHAQRGFGCVACHGGDGTAVGPGAEQAAKDPAKGYIGKPELWQIIEVCGRCHSDASFMKQYNPSLRVDQVTEYLTSVHGRRLRDEDDPNVATCADCHVAHSIKPASDPNSSVYPLQVADTCASCHADPDRMGTYGIATSQFDRYKESVHWEALSVDGDLSAPTCNDCHGNHGASPPGISWVGNVCGQCHVVMEDLFSESDHSEFLNDLGEPGCSACHANHAVLSPTDEFLGMGDEAICTDCHLPDDEGGEAATAMRTLIDSLQARLDAADSILQQAENVGMQVSQAQFELGDALSSLISARRAVHAFTVEAVDKEVEAGLGVTERAYARGLDALRELRFRRAGLAVSSLIILILIAGLLLKIREAEKKMEGTLDSVRSFFYESMRREGVAVTSDLRLAACAVLLELAYADRRFADSERAHLEELIRRQFDLDAAQAARLIALADKERTEARDISQFTGLIAEGFTSEQKTLLLKDMWSLVLSDGELARREEFLVERIARLLGLGSAAVADVRKEVSDR